MNVQIQLCGGGQSTVNLPKSALADLDAFQERTEFEFASAEDAGDMAAAERAGLLLAAARSLGEPARALREPEFPARWFGC